jgi:hypothetical protein
MLEASTMLGEPFRFRASRDEPLAFVSNKRETEQN